jgi:hypothetical protein
MRCLGKEVSRLDMDELVVACMTQEFEVSCQGSRLTADVHDLFRGTHQQSFDDSPITSLTGWVE